MVAVAIVFTSNTNSALNEMTRGHTANLGCSSRSIYPRDNGSLERDASGKPDPASIREHTQRDVMPVTGMKGLHVRLGSKAEVAARRHQVHFAPRSRRQFALKQCRLWANYRQNLLKSLQESPSKISTEVMGYSRYRTPRHAVRRGIQRGTFMRNASYSAPNDSFSVGSS